MSSHLKTVVVIPCYNEAERLDKDAFRDYVRNGSSSVTLLFVNDGSTDRTSDVVRELVEEMPAKLSLLNLPKNVGKAEAVRQGLLTALDANAAVVGFWDADLATPLPIIDELLALLINRPQLLWIFGSRVKMLGRTIDRRLVRHLAGRAFATAVSLTLDLDVYDTQCGAKLFRADRILRAVLSDPFNSRWVFDVELLARLAELGREGHAPALEQCVYEAPIRIWRDVKGSKVRAVDFLKAAGELSAIWRRYNPRERPKTSLA